MRFLLEGVVPKRRASRGSEPCLATDYGCSLDGRRFSGSPRAQASFGLTPPLQPSQNVTSRFAAKAPTQASVPM